MFLVQVQRVRAGNRFGFETSQQFGNNKSQSFLRSLNPYVQRGYREKLMVGTYDQKYGVFG